MEKLAPFSSVQITSAGIFRLMPSNSATGLLKISALPELLEQAAKSIMKIELAIFIII